MYTFRDSKFNKLYLAQITFRQYLILLSATDFLRILLKGFAVTISYQILKMPKFQFVQCVGSRMLVTQTPSINLNYHYF